MILSKYIFVLPLSVTIYIIFQQLLKESTEKARLW